MDDFIDARALREAVEAEARRLGFDLFGVTTPDAPPHWTVFERWLEAGRHGAMGYLATERSRRRRADPRAILPECRSIVAVGARYTSPGPTRDGIAPGGPGRGRMAAYAWDCDYHDTLGERLEHLAAFIDIQAGRPVASCGYVDTGPVLERDLAQRAGLGWIGKNTCLIHPELGSYFLLAEILVGIDLAVDEPFLADRCGSCTRCLDACPTGCILPDRTLDARRCISYLTIELKTAIPNDLRPLMGDWIFGCDLCQQVCPWNRRASGKAAPDVSELDRAFPELIEELSLTPEAFNQKFKGSPIRRAKRRGYLRNVAVALGNRGQVEAVPALEQALAGDPEPLVRAHAAWALGNLGGEKTFNILMEAIEKETHPEVRLEIENALKK